MQKRPDRVKYLIISKIKELSRFGESKHKEKQIERERCRREGKKWNPARVKYIYSYRTAKNYADIGVRFSRWLKEKYGINRARDLAEIKPYAERYVQERIDGNKSAWTVKQEKSALAKIFETPSQELFQNLQNEPRRRLDDRVQNQRGYPRGWSEINNQKQAILGRATGMRRHEARAARPEDFYERNGRIYVHTVGKGGRPREIPVLERYQEQVREIVHRARERDERVIEHDVCRTPWHLFRREYARDRLEELRDTGAPEKAALAELSQNLGHNRLDVLKNYLK